MPQRFVVLSSYYCISRPVTWRESLKERYIGVSKFRTFRGRFSIKIIFQKLQNYASY